MSLTDIEEEIKMLGTNKFTNSSDTPRKVLKQNVYFFPLDIYRKKHIGVSPVTGKKVKPVNNSAVYANLVHCNFFSLFDNFSILAIESKKKKYWKLNKTCYY